MTSSFQEDKLAAGEDLHRLSLDELDQRAAAEACEYIEDPTHSIAPLVAIKSEQRSREIDDE